MKKIFLSLLAFLLFPAFSMAGGKVFLSPGETLDLSPTVFLENPSEYIWEITGGEKNETQNGKDFSYTFQNAGSFFVTLTAKNTTGEQQDVRTEVIVAENQKQALPLKSFLFSTPQADENGEALLDTNSPKVLLYAKESEGNILEFRIDSDISVDSDNDGNPANDIDNKNHQSFSDGSAFPILYRDTTSSKTARLTVVDSDGETDSSNLSFSFAEKNTTDTLTAAISTLPPASARGDILVYGETADVIFFPAESLGDVFQYRIDTNIKIDSDNDGNPANDIDNKNHPSFKSGEAFQTTFSRENGNEQVVQLIAVSSAGQGSLLQRRVVFEQAQNAGFAEERKNEMNPLFLATASQVKPGETVDFHIVGVPSTATISWDFDGNGTVDHKGNETTQSYTYDNAGEYDAEVIITLGQGSVIRSEKIVVAEKTDPTTPENPDDNTENPTENPEGNSVPPVSDFTFEQDGSRLLFSSSATGDSTLPDAQLFYHWDFGNGKISDEENPQIAFEHAGDYTLSLTVTDSAGTQTVKEIPVTITAEDIQKTFPEGTPTPSSPADFTLQKTGATIVPSFAHPREVTEAKWNFGDGNTSTDIVPNHVFEKAGEYVVRVTTLDNEGNEHTTTQTVTVTEDDISSGVVVPTNPDNGENGDVKNPTEKKGFSWFKFLFYFPLILLFLLLIFIIVLLFFRKVQSPDLQFEEIVHEEVEGWREKMRVVMLNKKETPVEKEQIPSDSPFLHAEEKITPIVVEEEKAPTTETVARVAEDAKKSEESSVENLQKNDGKMPDWLKETSAEPKTNHPEATPAEKNKEVVVEVKEKPAEIITEIKAEQKPEKKTEPVLTPPEPLQKEEVPEWLKPVSVPTAPKNAEEKKEVKTEVIPAPAPVAQKPAPEKMEDKKDDMPDWLKPEEEKPVVTKPEGEQEKKIEKPVVPSVAKTVATSQKEDVPEWLKPEQKKVEVVKQEEKKITPPPVQPPVPEKKSEPKNPLNAMQDDENLPDWLKESANKVSEIVPKKKQEQPSAPEKKSLPVEKSVPPVVEQSPQRTQAPHPVNTQQVQQNVPVNNPIRSAPKKQVVPAPRSIPVQSTPKIEPQGTNFSAPKPAPQKDRVKKSISPNTLSQKPVSTKPIPDKPEIIPQGTEILRSVSAVNPQKLTDSVKEQSIGLSGEVDLDSFSQGNNDISGEANIGKTA